MSAVVLSQKKCHSTGAYCASVLAVFVVMAAQLYGAEPLDELYARLRTHELTVQVPDGAADFLSAQQADGSWPDIDYEDRGQNWSPNAHVKRLLAMAVAWGRPGLPTTGKAELLTAIDRGLQFWYAEKPSAKNWYKNDIGQQLSLGPTLLIVRDEIPEERLSKGCSYLNDPGMTGANLVWLASQTIWRGALLRKADDVAKGVKAIRKEVVITKGEGVQSDHSFLQHRRQLHLGQYGTTYVTDLAEWAHLLDGLPWHFDDAEIQLLGDCLLDGQQWVIRRGHRLPGNSGRAVSRPGALAGVGRLVEACADLAAIDPQRAQQFQAFAEDLAGNNDDALVGAKHFWRSDYFVQRRPGWALGVSMCSTRVLAQESINGENLHGANYTMGATWLECDGGEHAEIWPILDWARIPGTTVRYSTSVPAPDHGLEGGSAFVGGVSDGTYGAAVYQHAKAGVSDHTAWFAFDDAVVQLVCDIRSSAKGAAAKESVCTTLEQSWLRGAVTIATGAKQRSVAADTTITVPELRWLHHDGQGYVFPEPTTVTIATATRTGSWKSIHQYQSGAAISGQVFAAWIDHGVAPTGAAMACIRLPGADPAATEAWAAHPSIVILANERDRQAVHHSALDLTQAVFHAPGRIDIPGGRWLAVDQPCLVLWHASGILAVARPDAGGQCLVTLGSAEASRVVTVDLPTTPENGRSVVFDVHAAE